jgi:4-hydroxy-tetrahydrodipicolinate synthase
MIENEVRANGVISVISNIAPAMVQKMCLEILKGNHRTARRIKEILSPLFNIVTVNCEREIDFGGDDDDYYRVIDKFRNPVPIKTIMRVLGMPSGFCRPPLGKIVPSGIEIIRDALRKVWENNPEVLIPIQEFYNSNIKERIYDDKFWEEVTYRE